MKRTRWRCLIRVFTAAITAGLLVSQVKSIGSLLNCILGLHKKWIKYM